MGKILGKVVLTGGPCAGKTTALSRIEQELGDRGIKVITVSETATEIIKSGVKPFGNGAIDLFDFQKLILGLQMAKEKVYEEAPNYYDENQQCLIIYDRGIIDNKAYIGQTEFDRLLNELNLNEITLMDKYDMVIHLVTAADGKEEYYTLENNAARSESAEEAHALDKRTMNAWVGHNNLRIIDNSTDFKDKINRVLENIFKYLGMATNAKQQRKFSIDMNSSDLSILDRQDECVKIEISQTYLGKSDNGCEERLRKRTYNGESTYYYTKQIKRENGTKEIVIEKKITEKEYLKMMSLYDEKSTINKTRYTFIRDKQFFKFDLFEEGFAVLEVEPTKDGQQIQIPKELCVIEEVTNNPNFQNSFLSQILARKLEKTSN